MATEQSTAIAAEPPDIPQRYIALSSEAIFDRSQFSTSPARELAEDKMIEARDSINMGVGHGLVVKKETLDTACESFDRFVALRLTQTVDLLYHQHYLYSSHRFSEALVGAWAVTEQALGQIWRNYLDDRATGGVAISKKRREKLQGRDFTASIVQEVLGLASRLPEDVFSKIDEVRKARNDWIHFLKPATSEQSLQALQLCKSMLDLVYGIEFQLPMSSGSLHVSTPTDTG